MNVTAYNLSVKVLNSFSQTGFYVKAFY